MNAEDSAFLREVLSRVRRIEERLNALVGPRAAPAAVVPEKVRRAVAAREEARACGYYTTATLAAVIGRHRQWVTDRCAVKAIATLPGGKPYRIPLTEEARFNAR